MAALENEHLVVNVVYAGPPLAGKTQSMRTLLPLLEGRGAEGKVLSPGDLRGRTAFFDWAVYEGGTYEGKPIRCRIISTPGQVAFSGRRELLLRSADAVILVVDSQPEGLERAILCYEEMVPWLAESSRTVPVRLILQCNKQDLPGILSADELSRRLGVPCGKDVYPTSATSGKGLRAAFVAGVRNAVERARALVARGLVLDAPEIANDAELFDRMRRDVPPVASQPAPSAASEAAPSAVSQPAPSAAARPTKGARPNRGAGKAAGSAASSRGRPATSHRAAGSAASPLGMGKPAPASGFYSPSGSASSSNPERSGPLHRPLPPDHPFAPMRPNTPHPGTGKPRMRAGRGGGAQSPATPAEAVAGRSRADAPGHAKPGHGDTRRSLSAIAPRSAAEAATARAPAPVESPAPATISLIVPAAAALSSAPPSSAAMVSGPARSGRRALETEDDPVDSGWPEAGEVLSIPPPFESPVGRPLSNGPRPAVVPASAWRALMENNEPRNDRPKTSHEPSARRPLTPLGQAAPTPASVWPAALPGDRRLSEIATDRSLSAERPTVAAALLGQPDPDTEGTTSEFADPAAFGLESSRMVEPRSSPQEGIFEESSDAFRIPETPPGLQGFVAKARLSTPPPPAPRPSDDVIPSLVPSPAPDDGTERAPGNELQPPLEFDGPRMPGHVRAPRAVWRRSTWRTLEMHITSDATALEDTRGRWIGELAPGWYARTLRSATDARSARRAFAEEVLRERQLGQYLSRPRCVALTEEPDRFWIWQAACRVPTLAAVLARRLAARESPSAMAEALLDASLAFVEARARFIRARVPLPLSLHALSVQDDELVYSGLLPDPGAVFVHPPSDGHTGFEDALRKKWPNASVDGSSVFAELSGKAAGRLPEPILAIIRSVVGQSSIERSTNEAAR